MVTDSIIELTDPDDGDDVNVIFLWAFASANMLVDIASSFMFYLKRKEVFTDRSPDGLEAPIADAPPTRAVSIADGDRPKSRTQSRVEEILIKMAPPNLNVNMASAFTHVGADTMRTAAVFIAALISTVTGASGSACDAWAAIVVSFSISK